MHWILLPLAFALGTIPSGFLLYRWRRGGDIRRQGSGNIGATNVLRTAGAGLGVLTLLLDAFKGWLAVWLTLRLEGTAHLAAAALLLVIAGHIFSPWLGWRGGKGVATALGAFLALAPWALAGALLVFLLVLAAWRYVSLASICACVALPLLAAFLPFIPHRASTTAAAVAASALIIWRHGANLGRLRSGTEAKLGTRARGAV